VRPYPVIIARLIATCLVALAPPFSLTTLPISLLLEPITLQSVYNLVCLGQYRAAGLPIAEVKQIVYRGDSLSNALRKGYYFREMDNGETACQASESETLGTLHCCSRLFVCSLGSWVICAFDVSCLCGMRGSPSASR
jgi:hypothetical protein